MRLSCCAKSPEAGSTTKMGAIRALSEQQATLGSLADIGLFEKHTAEEERVMCG